MITGSAVNQDGRSSSLTAPNGLAQSAVIHAAMFEELETRDREDAFTFHSSRHALVDILQMHGTGTPLGDPIEASAAHNVFPKNRMILFGSFKSCAGHAEPAAGAVGLTALAKHLSELLINGNCHLRTLNPHVARISTCNHDECRNQRILSAVATMATTRLQSSVTCAKPRGGTSAFAFQGTNAHVRVTIDFPKRTFKNFQIQHDSHLSTIRTCDISLSDRQRLWPVVTTFTNTLLQQVTVLDTDENVNARFMIMFPLEIRNIFWPSDCLILSAAATTTALCPFSSSGTDMVMSVFLSRIVLFQKKLFGSNERILHVDVNSSGYLRISKLLDAQMHCVPCSSNRITSINSTDHKAFVLQRSPVLSMKQHNNIKVESFVKRFIPDLEKYFLSVPLSAALDLCNNAETELRDIMAVEAYKIWNENIRVSRNLFTEYSFNSDESYYAAILNSSDQRAYHFCTQS